MNELVKLIEKQKDFQRFVGFPIDSNLEQDRNELSEKYVFKLIEEAIELRKEFPSAMNPWSKKQKAADPDRIDEEMSDIFLFFLNLMIVWKSTPEHFLKVVNQVQNNNFMKVKDRKMKMLNESIENIPGYTVDLGFGNLFPKSILVLSHPEGREINMPTDDYVTYVVKCILPGNRKPTDEEIQYWQPILNEELEILKVGNPDVKINYEV